MRYIGLVVVIVMVLFFTAAASQPKSVRNTQNSGLTSIPTDAEIIFASKIHGEKDKDGFVAVELYVASSEGNNITRITHSRYTHNHFAVSPNRKMIAANRYVGDTNRDRRLTFADRKVLWVLDLENNKEWPLLEEYDAGWGGVDWSADGKYIYFSATKDRKNWDIYRVRPDGSGLENLTKNISQSLSGTDQQKVVADVSVSSDGKWITFIYEPHGGLGAPGRKRVAIARPDGSDPRLVTDGGSLAAGKRGQFSVGDFDPELSPDSKYIVFHRVTNKGYNWNISSGDVMIIGVDGSGLRKLSPANNKTAQGIPDWSDDGRIVFTEWNEAERYLGPVIMNTDGSGYNKIRKAFRGSHVRWIPE